MRRPLVLAGVGAGPAAGAAIGGQRHTRRFALANRLVRVRLPSNEVWHAGPVA
jgi:hypothetical protein